MTWIGFTGDNIGFYADVTVSNGGFAAICPNFDTCVVLFTKWEIWSISDIPEISNFELYSESEADMSSFPPWLLIISVWMMWHEHSVVVTWSCQCLWEDFVTFWRRQASCSPVCGLYVKLSWEAPGCSLTLPQMRAVSIFQSYSWPESE